MWRSRCRRAARPCAGEMRVSKESVDLTVLWPVSGRFQIRGRQKAPALLELRAGAGKLASTERGSRLPLTEAVITTQAATLSDRELPSSQLNKCQRRFLPLPTQQSHRPAISSPKRLLRGRRAVYMGESSGDKTCRTQPTSCAWMVSEITASSPWISTSRDSLFQRSKYRAPPVCLTFTTGPLTVL
jgi:hypothetical protein